MVNNKNSDKTALVFGLGNNIGGAERRLVNVFLALGYDCLVYVPTENTAIVDRLYDTIWSTSSLESIHLFHKEKQLLYEARNGKYGTLFFIDTSLKQTIEVMHAKFHGIRIIWVIASLYIAYNISPKLRSRLSFFINAHCADAVDCLYPAAKESLKHRLPPSLKVYETPLPYINIELYTPKSKKKEIVFAARLVCGKGLELFLDTVLSVKDTARRIGYRFIVCGDGPLRESARSFAGKHGIDDIVHFVGYVDMSGILPHAEVFMSLQDVCNYPSQVLLEAIASGCYIITFADDPDIDKIVGRPYGVLVDKSMQSISNALINYMTMSDSEKQEVVARGRVFAQRAFNFDASLKYYKHIVEL